jgi:hypothetical protein
MFAVLVALLCARDVQSSTPEVNQIYVKPELLCWSPHCATLVGGQREYEYWYYRFDDSNDGGRYDPEIRSGDTRYDALARVKRTIGKKGEGWNGVCP